MNTLCLCLKRQKKGREIEGREKMKRNVKLILFGEKRKRDERLKLAWTPHEFVSRQHCEETGRETTLFMLFH